MPRLNENTEVISHLAVNERKAAASSKYLKAVALYSATNLSIKEIAKLTGVNHSGFSAHLRRHHRDLLFRRHDIAITDNDNLNQPIKSKKGQSEKTYQKYKEAIEACENPELLHLNLSQIAAKFGLNPTALASQLKVHYPELYSEREKKRSNAGLNDHYSRGPRLYTTQTYEEASQLYRSSILTIEAIAEKFNISKGGFVQYLRFYHPEILEAKENMRNMAIRPYGKKVVGELSGNGRCYGPLPESDIFYANALHLYRTTSLTIDELATATDTRAGGFAAYMKEWHRDDIIERRTSGETSTAETDLKNTKQYLKATSEKYAPAIESLKERPRPVAEVAKEFGLHPDVFREYLKEHHPEIANNSGMKKRADGKVVKASSEAKYAPAIAEFASSTDTMKAIAERHGINYKSIMSFLKRNCPEIIEKHRKLVESAQVADS